MATQVKGFGVICVGIGWAYCYYPGFGFWNRVGGSLERRSDDFMRIHSLTTCGLYAGCTDLHRIHFLYIFWVDTYQNSAFAISISYIYSLRYVAV